MTEKKYVVYLLRCSDNTLYCGITNNIDNRLTEHNSGKGAKYTRSRISVELVGVSPEMTKSEALKLEYRIKCLPAEQKIAVLTGEETAMTMKQDLKAMQKEFKALGKKVEKLVKAVEKAEKTQAKAAKAKTTKKAPAKKKAQSKKTVASKTKATKAKKSAAKKRTTKKTK